MENRFTKSIPNFEGYYITSTGKVFSKTGKELKLHKNKFGYLYASLYKDKKLYNRYIHRLVYETFKGSISKGLSIDHIDENKTNNRIENLQEMKKRDNWQKFYDIEVNRNIEGFKTILEFPKYYINKDGKILSFKFGKSERYEGKIIYSVKGAVFLRKDDKRYAVSTRALVDKYFNVNTKKFNKRYKHLVN